MMDSEGRVARVLTKVLRSTLRDAHTDRLILAAPDTPEGGLVQRWCESAAIVLAGAPGENGLRVHPAWRLLRQHPRPHPRHGPGFEKPPPPGNNRHEPCSKKWNGRKNNRQTQTRTSPQPPGQFQLKMNPIAK